MQAEEVEKLIKERQREGEIRQQRLVLQHDVSLLSLILQSAGGRSQEAEGGGGEAASPRACSGKVARGRTGPILLFLMRSRRTDWCHAEGALGCQGGGERYSKILLAASDLLAPAAAFAASSDGWVTGRMSCDTY